MKDIKNSKSELEKESLISLGKTFLILMITVGVTITLTKKNIDGLFGFALTLLGLYGYYKFDAVKDIKTEK